MGLFDIFNTDNANAARDAQVSGITEGYNLAQDFINRGSSALEKNYASALQPFLTNINTANTGVNALTDALGLTGDPSQVQARFAATPGYQFQLQQGNENILRNASRAGGLNSGGTNIDLQTYGQGLADKTYGDYVNRLMPFLSYSTANAGGAGNIYTGLGQGVNANYGTLANLGWTSKTNIGNANANAELARNQASQNLWNVIGQGANLGAQFLPMLSDVRAKEDIEQVGGLYDGLGIYRYRYKGDATPRIGVMAQEVEERYPDAVAEVGGLKVVDYGRATDYASKLSRFLEAA